MDTKPFWMSGSSFVLNASGTAAAIFLVARFWNMPASLLLVPDAFGLALFTMIGIEGALAFSAPNTAAVLLGVMTGVAGGMIRDLLTGEIPLVLRTGVYLYATAALCGALTFVIITPHLSSPLA